jgi:hypothetical protein
LAAGAARRQGGAVHVQQGVKQLRRRHGGTFGRYLPSANGEGHLVYINNGTLFAVGFDPSALEVRGTPAPVLDRVAYSPQSGAAQFDFSRTGMLVYRSGGAEGMVLLTVQWLDSEGKTRPLVAQPGRYMAPSLSPDGQRLALEVADGANRDVWIYDPRRDAMTRLTFQAGEAVMNESRLEPRWPLRCISGKRGDLLDPLRWRRQAAAAYP